MATMTANCRTWGNDTLGQFVVVELSTTAPAPSLDDGLLRRPDLDATLVLDTSGSMGPHLPVVLATALGAVDMLQDGSSLRVITFNSHALELVPRTTLLAEVATDAAATPAVSVREAVKASLRLGLNRCQGGTNIEGALALALDAEASRPGQALLLMTDGLANCGLKSSTALSSFARSLPAFPTSVFHTLGVQEGDAGLNAQLLRDLARDTAGTFSVAAGAEALTTFLGDLVADHAMRAFEGVRVVATVAEGATPVGGAATGGSGTGLAAAASTATAASGGGGSLRCLSAMGACGGVIRHDRPLKLVFQLPATAATLRIQVDATPSSKREEPRAAEGAAATVAPPASMVHDMVVASAERVEVEGADVALIVGAIVAPFVEAGDRVPAAVLEATRALATTNTHVAPILALAEAAGARRGLGEGGGMDSAAHVRRVVASQLASSGSTVVMSPVVEAARHTSHSRSSAYMGGWNDTTASSTHRATLSTTFVGLAFRDTAPETLATAGAAAHGPSGGRRAPEMSPRARWSDFTPSAPWTGRIGDE